MGFADGKEKDEESITSTGTKDKKEKAAEKVPILTLFRYATPFEKFLFIVGLCVAMITGSALPVMSIFQGNIAQSFVNEEMYRENLWNVTHPKGPIYNENDFTNTVINIIYEYSGMAFAIFIASNIQICCLMIVCENMSNRIRKEFVKAVLRQDITWFDKNNSGTLAPKLFDSLERVKEGTGDKLGLLFQYISQFFTGFTIGFVHSWKLTLIMLALTPFQAACGFAIVKSMTTFTMQEQLKYSVAGRLVEQAISSIRTVVSLNGLPFEIYRYGIALLDARRSGILKNLFVGIAFGCMGLVNFSSLAVAFYIGVGWVHSGEMQVNDLLTTFFAVMMGGMALGQAGPQFAVLGTAQGAAAPIFEVLDREPDIDSRFAGGVKDKEIKGNIEVRNVNFQYPSRPDVQVLRGINLKVNAGEKVALVGSSGCGKSTIVSLLLRYYDVPSGDVTLDGVPISSYNLEFLRQQIAVVSQEPILFNCTIEENIRYGRSDITEAEMIEACKSANAHMFVSGLPQGYHTVVGDRGTQLSGGQKQRIAIARALVRDPKIILLDEATSALDAESEGLVQAALDKVSKGRTTIIIAHRLSTIRNADKIIAIKEGKVHEQGTHDYLLARKGLYYDLVSAQTFTDAVDDVKATKEIDLGRQISAVSHRRSTTDSLIDKVGAANDLVGRIRTGTLATIEPAAEEVAKKKKDDITRLKDEFKAEGGRKTNLLEIISYAKRHWHFIAIGLTACISGGLVFPIYSVFFTTIIKTFTDPSTMLKKGHFWALMFLVLAAVQAISLFTETFFMGVAAEMLSMDLRSALYRNIMSMNIGYFDSPLHASGKICTRLAMDVPNLKNAIDFRLSTVLMTFISIGAGIGLAFYFGWQLALLVVAIFPLLATGQYLRTRVLSGRHRISEKDFEDSGKIAMEAIEHVRTVQALTRENTMHNKFCMFLKEPHREAIRQTFIQGVAYGVATSVIFVMLACSYRLGLALILNGDMTPIRVLRVIYAVNISAATIGFAMAYFPEYMKARLAGGLIFGMLKQKSSIDNLSSGGTKPVLSGAVSFENVKFFYPERPSVEVLKGLSFSVQPGHTLALVGPSGCGKSTVVALIERFYDAISGTIKLDDHDIQSLNPYHMRSQIAIVSQEPILFDASIADNIVYGIEDRPSIETIIEATTKANIHEFIAKLPEGYNTSVGDKGTQLSGGQKQRIAIARALIRKPKILLLDEATSALDTESEKVVQDALDRAREGRTCIVIAHRLSTIVNADSIAVVKAGVIVEQGTHSELIHKGGVYFELTQKQTAAKAH